MKINMSVDSLNPSSVLNPYSKYKVENDKNKEREVQAVSTLFAKGIIQLPSPVRKHLGVKDGEKIISIKEGNRFYVMNAKIIL